MQRYRIRKVDETDPDVVETIKDMHREVFTDGTQVPDIFGHWWIAYLGDEPAAFAGMFPSVRRKRGGYLCRAGVLPGHRGHGLQRRLIRVRERKAKELGWTILVTDTTQNPVSSNNLIACGFRVFSPRVKWSFADAIYFRKKLVA